MSRVALVTGATGSLGQALCLALAASGCDIAIHHRGTHDAEAARLASDIEGLGRRTCTVVADLGADDIDRLSAEVLGRVEATLGVVDVVVLNASSQALTPWSQLDAPAWDALYRGILRHTASLLTASAARMASGSGGVVLVIGSIEGIRPAPQHSAYAVFKSAVHALVAAGAQEFGRRGVRVVGIAPGLIDRPGLSDDWPDGYRRWCTTVPLGRPVTVTEVSDAVAFLASAAASAIAGVVLPVDGGWSAGPGW